MARILTYLDAPMWRAVRELYLQDKVVEALYEADQLGGLDSNDLYAEAEVRRDGTKWKLRAWLSWEAIESEVPHVQEIGDLIAAECESLSKRFRWDHREDTLVALLPQDVEAPWMPGRWGYFVDKVPYDKICLPRHLVGDRDNLIRTIQHEFMHDVTVNLAGGRASRWLSEAMSTYAENRLDREAWKQFQLESLPWLDPVDLEGMVSTDNRKEELRHAISGAYAQANLIARFLASQFGEDKLGELLRSIGDESFLESLQTEILARSHVDTGLRKVFHLSEHDVFTKAHEWVLSTPVPRS